jgi:hypothetical protein
MGLPSVTSAVFLIAKSLVIRGRLGVSETHLLSVRGSSVSGIVCMYDFHWTNAIGSFRSALHNFINVPTAGAQAFLMDYT